MIVKKKNTSRRMPSYPEGLGLFTYLISSSIELTKAMIERKAVCIAYETVEDEKGRLPLLTPMSKLLEECLFSKGQNF